MKHFFPTGIYFLLFSIVFSGCETTSLRKGDIFDNQTSFVDSVAVFHNQALELFCNGYHTKTEYQLSLSDAIDYAIACGDSVLHSNNVNYSLISQKQIITDLTFNLFDRIYLNDNNLYIALCEIIENNFSEEEADYLKNALNNNFSHSPTKAEHYFFSVEMMNAIGRASTMFWETKGFWSDGSAAADAVGGVIGCAFPGAGWLMLGVSIAWSASVFNYKNTIDYVSSSETD